MRLVHLHPLIDAVSFTHSNEPSQVNWQSRLIPSSFVWVYLEVGKEAVEFSFGAATVEVLSAGVEQGANQTDAEQMLRGVEF